MSSTSVLQLFDNLGVWTNGTTRAPHKPLLVLLALARWSRDEHSPVSFKEIDGPLTSLLKEFGPSRKSHHPEYPFWYLQNDGVWTLHAADDLKARKGKKQPQKSEFLAHNVTGEFSPDVQAALRADPGLALRIATSLLEAHFPDSLHADILEAVGFDMSFTVKKAKKRDPNFRPRVLTAYQYRCAVCEFDVRLGSVSIALDAAHIRWHQANGPDLEINGLALCSLHHKTFDLGAYTVNAEGILLVSDQAN
jgi:putative restriction endonuclease